MDGGNDIVISKRFGCCLGYGGDAKLVTDENYQKRAIAEEILRQVPEARVTRVQRDEDPRDYRVDFSKIRDVLDFRITRRMPDGVREVRELVQSGLISDPRAPIYSNT